MSKVIITVEDCGKGLVVNPGTKKLDCVCNHEYVDTDLVVYGQDQNGSGRAFDLKQIKDTPYLVLVARSVQPTVIREVEIEDEE